MEIKSDIDYMSYALGINMAFSLRNVPLELNKPLVAEAIAEILDGKEPRLSHEEYREWMTRFQEELRKLEEKGNAEAAAAAAAAVEEEKKFMAENGKKDGVITTASGLQYEVLQAGNGGDKPGPRDVVKVHYEGKLLNGNIFDSSIQRGEPIEFPVNQVIAGWTEALQLMEVGSKFRLFIPAKLGYGAQGAGNVIPPNSALIFEVELLGFKKN